MPSIVRVPLEDVYPSERNPRTDFGDIAELARSFELNAESPGEPFNAPVVVRDGGIYWIVDGERRYRAMRHAGLTHANVLVCEGMDEANALVAMLATDDKKPLSEIERSRGFQDMLLLGVDPERAERAGRVAPGTAAKVRRAREAVDDAAEDMSLLRLIAISELADDPEAVEELTNCTERDFPAIERRLRAERREAEAGKALAASLAAAGIVVLEMPRDAERLDGMAHYLSVSCVEAIPSDAPEGLVAVLRGAHASVYRPEPEADPEEEARRARGAELAALWEGTLRSRDAWLAEHACEPMPALLELCEDGGSPYSYSVERLLERLGVELPKGPADAMLAYLRHSVPPARRWGDLDERACERFARLSEALARCGYEPCIEERALLRAIGAEGGEAL